MKVNKKNDYIMMKMNIKKNCGVVDMEELHALIKMATRNCRKRDNEIIILLIEQSLI